MTLLLDGEQVRGKNLKITANMRIEAADMSGQTSNTETAHKGFKPNTLTASMMIPYVDQVQLRDLMRMAEATEGGGQLKTYRVVNDTASAFGIRQVEFSEGVSAREDDTPQCLADSVHPQRKSIQPAESRGAAPGQWGQGAIRPGRYGGRRRRYRRRFGRRRATTDRL